MRSRRQFRPAQPGFALNLPTDSHHSEVQVQQQNETEVNKFFIDVDDTMVSPMVTTNPSKVGARGPGTFTTRPAFPHAATLQQPSPVAGLPPTVPRKVTDAPAVSYMAALTAPHPLDNGKYDGAPASSGGEGAALKFIHVNNTNLFVLLDGISMFFEGKSTFTGSQDPRVLEVLEKKRRERREKKIKKARELAASAHEEKPAGSPVDTLERAIRDIEDNVANIFSPDQRPHFPTTDPGGAGANRIPSAPSSLDLNGTLSPVVETPVSTVQPCHAPAAPAVDKPFPPAPPSQFTSLFANAKPPAGSPLFGHQRAAPPSFPLRPPDRPRAQSLPSHDTVASPTSTSSCVAETAPTLTVATEETKGNQPTLFSLSASVSDRRVTGAWPSSTDARAQSLANASFSSHASSHAPSLRRGASSASLRTLAEANGCTVSSDAPGSSLSNVRVHHDRYPSLPGVSATSAPVVVHKASHHGPAKKTPSVSKTKPLSMEDIGHSNRSFDIDQVEYLDLIGTGSQGKVFRVRLDGKLYALKCMDLREATEATNSEERQGRKRGLVKELIMIRSQRENPPPKHLMQMFNAVANLDDGSQQLNLLIELMSFAVEDCQKMVARIPPHDMMSMTQSTFRDHMAGDSRSQQDAEKLLKQQNGSCMHVLGRSSHLSPLPWEHTIERQTPMPEIVLSMLAADVLRGLRELHQIYGIVHCDLKPANVLLCYDRQSFKVADFGCSSTMDPETKKVRRSGVDLGSKLYKAPERLRGDFNGDIGAATLGKTGARTSDDGEDTTGYNEVVEFSGKADVWSLGIMLLELSCGVHPCSTFKSDFWNYRSQLKLSKMVKPLTWSPAFCDFIVRCVCVDESKRWSVKQLIGHPFVLKSQSVPRTKLRMFMDRLEKDSATYQRRQQLDALRTQIELSTAQLAGDNHTRESRAKWGKFNSPLKVVPDWNDPKLFPSLN